MLDFEKYRQYFNKHDLFSVNNGLKLTELREGYAKVELVIDKNSKNYMGSLHGGLLYTMADVAAGTAMVFCGRQGVTLSAHTEYIKAAVSGKVIAEGRMVSYGKTVSRLEVDIHSEDGTLYGRSYITMYITHKNITIPEQKYVKINKA